MSVGARHGVQIVELAVERLRRKDKVVADGYSRDRVKLYMQLRCIRFEDEKEWYRGRFDF